MNNETDHSVESDASKIIFNFMVETKSRTMETEFYWKGKRVIMEFKITSIDGIQQ